MALNDVLAIATQKIASECIDILQQSNPLYKHFNDTKKYVDGGTFYQVPIMANDTLSNGFLPLTNPTISINDNQNFISAQFFWKLFYMSTNITANDQIIAGSSDQAVLDFIKLKMNASKNSAIRNLSAAIFLSADSTANSLNGFNGLADIFAPSGTAYGGLLDTTYPNWAPIIDTTTSLLTYTQLSKMISTLRDRVQVEPVNNLTGRAMKPDLIISNSAVRSQFISTYQPQVQYSSTKDFNVGTDSIMINNGMQWYSDSNCQGSADGSTADNFCYVLSKESIIMFYKYWFGERPAPFNYSGNLPSQAQTTTSQYLAANMACSNRRVNGVFKNLVA